MSLTDYLLRDVEPVEYMILKGDSKGILLDVVESFDEELIDKISKYESSLSIKYNQNRNIVGIFDGEKLFIDNSDLKDSYEQMFVQTFHKTLEKRLERIRLNNEEWFETIPGYNETPAEKEKEPDNSKKSSSEQEDNIPF